MPSFVGNVGAFSRDCLARQTITVGHQVVSLADTLAKTPLETHMGKSPVRSSSAHAANVGLNAMLYLRRSPASKGRRHSSADDFLHLMGTRLVLIVPIYAIAPNRVLMITESAFPFLDNS